MDATLLVRRRERQRPGTFTEIVISRLPRHLPGRAHRYKFRLALVDQNVCVLRYQNVYVLRYDNEAGKGDHRHLGDMATPYQFTTIERLLEDFDADTRVYLDEHSGDR
jgi:hypothetical protein